MTGARSRIEILKSEGLRAAKIRKHFMGHWLQKQDGRAIHAVSECVECGAHIVVTNHPEKIGGTATSQDCK